MCVGFVPELSCGSNLREVDADSEDCLRIKTVSLSDTSPRVGPFHKSRQCLYEWLVE